MLSELVTNALCHARRLVMLEVQLSDDALRVAVVDDAPGRPTLGEKDPGVTRATSKIG